MHLCHVPQLNDFERAQVRRMRTCRHAAHSKTERFPCVERQDIRKRDPCYSVTNSALSTETAINSGGMQDAVNFRHVEVIPRS